MQQVYTVNGIPFWTEQDIKIRSHLKSMFAFCVAQVLKAENRAWDFIEIEAPLLTPVEDRATNRAQKLWYNNLAKDIITLAHKGLHYNE